MNDLKRELAPIDNQAWGEIEAEVTRTLKRLLTARKLIDFEGPYGWEHSAVPLGRVQELAPPPAEEVVARTRLVQPMVELRIPFELSRKELDAVSRGAADPDLQPAVHAARQLALAENRTVFHGYGAAGVEGISEASTHDPVRYQGDFSDFPKAISEGIEALREAGIAGPYALALEPDAYNTLAKTAAPVGYPVIRHAERLVDAPIAWAPGLEGGLVLSRRGGDFQLTVGRDVSIGYLDHDLSAVRLYLEESIASRVLTPEAATAIQLGG